MSSPLTAAALLDVWEQGQGEGQIERALLLLAAADPEAAPAQLAQLSIGQRDRLLLALREECFGANIVAVASCPECGERLELDFAAADLLTAPGVAPEVPDAPLMVTVAGYTVQFRLPDSADLQAVARLDDIDAARSAVLARCILSAEQDGEQVAVADLPDEVRAAVIARMEAADPEANIELRLTCPACGKGWAASFDIATFFWAEIEAWARRTLREIHALAAAYGWREADILALSARRRQHYLEMITG